MKSNIPFNIDYINPLFSICIPTFNRANYLRETLENLIQEIGNLRIPIYISDNASTDSTKDVFNYIKLSYSNIFYQRNNVNEGIDANIVKCVSMSSSKYVWLFGDDDLIIDNTIKKLYKYLLLDYDVIVINSSTNNIDFSKQIEDKHLKIINDKHYSESELERFFLDTALYTTFIGSLIFKRSIWNSIDSKIFINTDFVHTGIIYSFLHYKNCYLVSEPLIKIRLGNASWSKRYFSVWMINFPKVIWSLPPFYNNITRNRITGRFPYQNLKNLLRLRASYRFSYDDYKKFINSDLNTNIILKFLSFLISISSITVLNFLYRSYFWIIMKKISDYEKLYFIKSKKHK